MRRLFFLPLLAVLLMGAAFAQNGYVTVTATIPSYMGGQATASFQNQSTQPQLPLLNNSVFATTAIGNLDVNGKFTVVLADNALIQPNPSQWQIIVCAKAGNPAQPCFPVTATITCVSNSACQNGVLDISSQFAAAPAPPSTDFANWPTLYNQIASKAYADYTANAAATGGIVPTGTDGSIGGENNQTDKYFADLHPITTATDGSSSMTMPGWDTAYNMNAQHGYWTCASAGGAPCAQPGYGVHELAFPCANSWTAQAMFQVGLNNWSTIGFNWAQPGQMSAATGTGTGGLANASTHVTVGFNSGGLFVDVGGVVTPIGTTINGLGEVSLHYLGNGQLQVNATAWPITKSWTLVYSITPPTGCVQNFEVRSTGINDQQRFVRYSVGGPFGTNLDMPYTDTAFNLLDQIEETAAGGTWALIPYNYKPGSLNRWVLYDHGYNAPGCAPAACGGVGGVPTVATALVDSGYVVIGMNNTVQNCYGNAQCVADHAAVIQQWQSLLSLAPQGYGFADSMGGLSLLTAMMQGSFHPKAIALMCPNTNLAWDYNTCDQTGGCGQSVINTAFGITQSNPYSTATAGYDPQLAAGAALNSLLVPTQIWASYADTIVNRGQNADLLAAKLNGVQPGTAQVNTCTGNHEDASCFVGPAVVHHFNSH